MEQIIVAYVPVIHAGYIEFFRQNGGAIYLIDKEIVPEVHYLSRDLRAVSTELTARLLLALGLNNFAWQHRIVEVATQATLEELGNSAVKVVMPDEDVSRIVAQKYFNNSMVQLETVFLRWHWNNVKKAEAVSPDRLITTDEMVRELMIIAQENAQQSSDWWRQVGAVLVKDGVVIGSSYNQHYPTEHTPYIDGDPRTVFGPGESIEVSSAHHAEKELIISAARSSVSTLDAEMIVTTFPCPVCAMAIVKAGICRVYYRDGYSLVHAEDIFRAARVELIQVL